MKWLLLSLSAACSLAAADLTGTWIGKIAHGNDYEDVAFKLLQRGSALSGKMYGDARSFPLASGIVSGQLVTFVVNLQEQAGNQINDSRIRFSGKINGDEMELYRERESSSNAGNGGAVHIKNDAKRVCRLKLLTQ